MKLLPITALAGTALWLQPVVDQACGDVALRPDLCLAAFALAVSLCPGPAAVVWCGFLGLILDCVAGPQLGGRAACFCALAALASLAIGRREQSWPRRIAVWAATLFVAELLSSLVQMGTVGGSLRPVTVISHSAAAAVATTALLIGVWLAGRFLWRGPRWGESRQFSVASGRDGGWD
jgi:cell shape-determining protein MreD